MTKVFNENLKKFHQFYSQVLNPLTICKIILDINNLQAEKSAASGEGNMAIY